VLHLILILLFAVAAGFVEYGLLEKILTHPASGPPADGALLQLSLWAALPLVVCVLVGLFAMRVGTLRRNILVPLIVACAVGPLFALVALRQYGHATPGILFLGFVVQVLFVLTAAVRTYRYAA
jgi:hypothetical protein